MPVAPYTGASYSTYIGSDIANASKMSSIGKGYAPTNYLPALMAVQAVTGAYSTYQQARAQKAIYQTNARVAEMQARDAMNRGQEAEARSRQKTKKFRGSQRTALAAQGIRLDSGSALDVQMETEDIGELDALTIRNNALREAFGFRTEARSASMQGRLASQASMNQGIETLLTGGLRAVHYYEKYK